MGFTGIHIVSYTFKKQNLTFYHNSHRLHTLYQHLNKLLHLSMLKAGDTMETGMFEVIEKSRYWWEERVWIVCELSCNINCYYTCLAVIYMCTLLDTRRCVILNVCGIKIIVFFTKMSSYISPSKNVKISLFFLFYAFLTLKSY